jgi:hypothetical protein
MTPRTVALTPERTTPVTLAYPLWLGYEARQLEEDRKTLQEVVYSLTAPTPPVEVWKAMADIAARYATVSGVGCREFFNLVSDSIAGASGDIPPVIHAIDAVLGDAA